MYRAAILPWTAARITLRQGIPESNSGACPALK
jgi:hypothetical protein